MDTDTLFRMRLIRGVQDAVIAWLFLLAVGEGAREVILADHRAEFDLAASRLEAAIDRLLVCVIELDRQGASAEDAVVDALRAIDAEGLAIMGMIVNPRSAPIPANVIKAFDDTLIIADFLEREFGQILLQAMSLRIALEHLRRRPGEARTLTVAERSRRRRRVAFQAAVNVYDDDIALLVQYGLLTPVERDDPALVTKQLEAFLAYGFLTYPHAAAPWRARAARQQGRLRDLSERKDAQDPQ